MRERLRWSERPDRVFEVALTAAGEAVLVAGVRQAYLGRRAAALAPIEVAVTIRRRLADRSGRRSWMPSTEFDRGGPSPNQCTMPCPSDRSGDAVWPTSTIGNQNSARLRRVTGRLNQCSLGRCPEAVLGHGGADREFVPQRRPSGDSCGSDRIAAGGASRLAFSVDWRRRSLSKDLVAINFDGYFLQTPWRWTL
jgi:hypothetical protein